MNKNRAIGALEDARDNALDLLNIELEVKHKGEKEIVLIEQYKAEILLLEEYIESPGLMAFELQLKLP